MSARKARARLCAHADANGNGMHWLEPGEVCPLLEPAPSGVGYSVGMAEALGLPVELADDDDEMSDPGDTV